eukprot:363862-Chlamydomonas_euryale.AAC.15
MANCCGTASRQPAMTIPSTCSEEDTGLPRVPGQVRSAGRLDRCSRMRIRCGGRWRASRGALRMARAYCHAFNNALCMARFAWRGFA